MLERDRRLHLRFRIVLLYVLTLFFTLSLFSACLYFYFSNEISRRVDVMLDLKAQGLENSIKTYLKTREITEPAGWFAFLASSRKKDEAFWVITGLLTKKDLASNAGRLEMAATIFDRSGKLIASTHRLSRTTVLDPVVLRNARVGRPQVHNVKIKFADGRRIPVRALTRPVVDGKKVEYIIQVGASLKPIGEELGGIGRALFFLTLITLLITSWAGLLLVKITLSPVDRMVRRIRNIRSDNLDNRIQLPHTNDEIARLAETFNQMLARLDRSFVSQRQIVQDISHELKTPLTILRGQLEVALKKTRDPAEYEEILKSGLEEIESIRRIIDNLLTLARLDAQTSPLETEPVDLGALAASVIEDIRVLAGSKGVEVHFQNGQPATLSAHPIHLRRLLMNLLDNAVKYTPAGGKVTLDIGRSDKGAEIRVSDTGVGISEEHLPHLFDRFYRVDKVRQVGEGYGLGLSIAKSIVEAHHGRIEVGSKPGKGTTFRIVFPPAQAPSFLN
ncbi:MAG: heavy metal sensor histidine kinase [Candidatus Omnitrophica bacterium]|nr:heavy metal sensor histidine kinase [Candidatus Omnitrophota bacterium]